MNIERRMPHWGWAITTALLIFFGHLHTAQGCTGIRLIAKDGAVVYGRTMEWGAFDPHSRAAIFPRGHKFTGLTPDGLNGKTWTGTFGFVGLDMINKECLADGMNEKGLAAGMFYHPGFAEYPEYEPLKAKDSITAFDLVNFVLSQFSTVEEVRAGLKTVAVVPVVEEAIAIPLPGHWMITDPSGASIVVEFTGGQLKIHDNYLGVITNAPNYDWHLINLRNFVNLSAVELPSRKIADLDFTALGRGSGMIGLPGDFTPPSRFVRAVAWTQTARPTPNADETVYELFRILDNFNLPLGSAEGPGSSDSLQGMRSSTIWTTALDLTDRVFYYHTQHNRRVRKLDLGSLDFASNFKKITFLSLDENKQQDVLDITPTP